MFFNFPVTCYVILNQFLSVHNTSIKWDKLIVSVENLGPSLRTVVTDIAESGYSPLTRTQNLNVKLRDNWNWILIIRCIRKENWRGTWKLWSRTCKFWVKLPDLGKKHARTEPVRLSQVTQLRCTYRCTYRCGWRCRTLAEGRVSRSYLFVISQEVHTHPNPAIFGAANVRQGQSWLSIQLTAESHTQHSVAWNNRSTITHLLE